jgi:hypothetical protein
MDRARAWLAVGAVAAAMTAAALGATAAPPRDITADQALVAARDVMPAPALTPPPADEKPVVPTADPIVIGDPHGGMGGLPSQDPMDMGGTDMDGHGQGASPSPSPSPGESDGHDADSSPMPADDHGPDMGGSPMPVDDHGTTGDDDHGGAAAGGGDADGGHGDGDPTAERPRELVLGGFGLLNGLVFAAAALLRRRDRAAAARKAAATIERAFINPTDASR